MDNEPLQRLRIEPRTIRLRRAVSRAAEQGENVRAIPGTKHRHLDEIEAAGSDTGALETRRRSNVHHPGRMGERLRDIRVSGGTRDQSSRARSPPRRPDNRGQRPLIHAYNTRAGNRDSQIIHSCEHHSQI